MISPTAAPRCSVQAHEEPAPSWTGKVRRPVLPSPRPHLTTALVLWCRSGGPAPSWSGTLRRPVLCDPLPWIGGWPMAWSPLDA